MKHLHILRMLFPVVLLFAFSIDFIPADEPEKGDVKKLDLGGEVSLALCFLPPGRFMMGSTAAEKAWATGIEGGAQPGTVREKCEGDSGPMQVKTGFWMGRTEVTVGAVPAVRQRIKLCH